MGIDMTSDHLVQETGLTPSAISFRKGCYIGQEVISRIRTVGKVNKSLCRLTFNAVPSFQGEIDTRLMAGEKEAGIVTSLAVIPGQNPQVTGLGYVKRAFVKDCDFLCLAENEGVKVKVKVVGEPSATGIMAE